MPEKWWELDCLLFDPGLVANCKFYETEFTRNWQAYGYDGQPDEICYEESCYNAPYTCGMIMPQCRSTPENCEAFILAHPKPASDSELSDSSGNALGPPMHIAVITLGVFVLARLS
jgi:hypothetical protein